MSHEIKQQFTLSKSGSTKLHFKLEDKIKNISNKYSKTTIDKTIMEKNKVATFTDDMEVTVTHMRHITKIKYVQRSNTEFPIKVLSQDEKQQIKNKLQIDADYLHLKSGEYAMFKPKIENRSENIKSLRKTFKHLSELINNNFEGDPTKEKFITLTYKENMTDVKKLNNNLDYFIKNLRKEIGQFEYITVIEPQQRGAWHAHILLKSETWNFIPYEIINKCWCYRGFTEIQTLEMIDNIGAYLVAYLTDLEVENPDPHDIFIKERKNKKYEKGARLHLYPPKMNLYRTSKGIKKPEQEKTTYKEAKKKIPNQEPTYQQTVKIYDENNNYLNTVMTEYYNNKRSQIKNVENVKKDKKNNQSFTPINN